MMLLRKEILKIVKDKKYLLAVFGLLILSILLFEFDLSLSDNMKLSQSGLYDTLEEELSSKSISDLDEEIKVLVLIDNAISSDVDMESLVGLYSQDQLDEYLRVKTIYGDHYFNNATLIIKQMKMLENVGDYYNYNQDVLEEVEYLLSTTSTSNRHQYDYLQKLSTIYEKLSNTDIVVTNNLSVDAYVSANYRELIIIMFIIVTTYTLINVEVESDMFDVLSVTEKGRRTLSKYKLLTLIIMTTAFVMFNELILILYTVIKFGNFSWLASIQSYQSLISSPLSINVLEMIVYGIVLKIIHGIVISSFVYGVLSIFENINIGIFILVIMFGYFAYQYYGIHDSSVFRNFKYLNLFSFGMVFKMIQNFVFLNFGFISVSWLTITILLLIILSIAFTVLSHYLYNHQNGFIRIKRMIKHRVKISLKTISLFIHELYKGFVMEGSALVLTLFIGVVVVFGYQIYSEEVSNYSTSINKYIDEHGGLIDDAFNAHIESEIIYYDDIKSKHDLMIKKYNKGEVSDMEYQEYLEDFTPINYNMNVFKSVLNRLNHSDVYFINTSGYNNLTSQYNYKNDTFLAYLVIMVLIVIISNFFNIDHSNHEAAIYDVSYKGFKNRSKFKVINTVLLTVLLLIITTGVYTLMIKFKYGLNYNSIPLSNIIDLEVNSIGFLNNPKLLDLSINKYLLLVFTTRLVGMLFIALSSLFVAYKIKDRSIVILVLVFILLLPSVLYNLGFKIFSYLSVFDLISGNLYYRTSGHFTKLIVVSILVVILLLYFIRLIYKGKGSKDIYY